MVLGRLLAAALVCLLAVGCGGDGGSVDPISRSELSRDVPEVNALQLTDALPDPADFGPGWIFDTSSLGEEDYLLSFALFRLGQECEGAHPEKAGLSLSSPHKISGMMTRQEQPGYVWMRIAVDSPAASADRMTLMRTAYTDCGSFTYEDAYGNDFTERYEVLDAAVQKVDESFAVRITSEAVDEDVRDRKPQTWSYARSGGLVVALGGQEGADTVPLLSAAVEEARTALGL